MSEEFDSEVLDLVKQKEFYPDEYISSFEKFKEKLPDKNKCYSSLSDKEISDKVYQDVLKVWNKFEMKTIHHNLYLKWDVLLLADYCHYLSAPVLSWDAVLSLTKVKLGLISGIDRYFFFERN